MFSHSLSVALYHRLQLYDPEEHGLVALPVKLFSSDLSASKNLAIMSLHSRALVS